MEMRGITKQSTLLSALGPLCGELHCTGAWGLQVGEQLHYHRRSDLWALIWRSSGFIQIHLKRHPHPIRQENTKSTTQRNNIFKKN